MKLDSEDKLRDCLRFIIGLRSNNKSCLFCCNLFDYGFTDLCLFTATDLISLDKIEKKLKVKKEYETLESFIFDLTKLFTKISDYLLSDDPLQ